MSLTVITTILRELLVALVASATAIWGNNFIQDKAKKEPYREKVYEDIKEAYYKISQNAYTAMREYYPLTVKPDDLSLKTRALNLKLVLLNDYFTYSVIAHKSVLDALKGFVDSIVVTKTPPDNPTASKGKAVQTPDIRHKFKQLINAMRKHLCVDELTDIDELMRIVSK